MTDQGEPADTGLVGEVVAEAPGPSTDLPGRAIVGAASAAEIVQRSSPLLRLRPEQLDLVEALQERGGGHDYANMYKGVLCALVQDDNPLRYVLAAHALRELMEKLPFSYDVPAAEPNLKTQVTGLHDRWKTTQQATGCRGAQGWGGQIDRPLAKFLRRLEEFFTEFGKDNRPQEARADRFLRQAEFRPVALPDVIRQSQAEQWALCYGYFVRVAHQRVDPDNAFDRWLSFLERFLLDRLAPRTRADRADIDQLIARGEGR